MAVYKQIILLERTGCSPSSALNDIDSIAADLTKQLTEKLALEDPAAYVEHYQFGQAQAGGRRHYYLIRLPDPAP